MSTLFEIIKFAAQSSGNFITTLAVIMFIGIAVFFTVDAMFPIFKIDRSTHNHYPEKKDLETI